ncbi:MAG TPA: hypothetical protein VHM90_02055 [Phycisphaerae bacterium]|jgi:hypothetical protein|nr:hypothetical protein [Phycisphaerae bacterium]
MSNIPNSAVSAALTPAQRAGNEIIRARKVQSQKNFHHQEEVEELDDTAVSSVTDEQEARERRERRGRRRAAGEQVEIESLKEGAPEAEQAGDGQSHLDISA